MKNIVRTAKKAVLVLTMALLTTASAANINNVAVCLDAAEKVQWSKALPACIKAAEQGDKVAQTMLGLGYYEGRGIAQDYVQAVRWYRLAAAQGNADAQSSLGMMYEDGQGVAQDKLRAHMWFNLAAAKNDWYRWNRDNVAKRMTREQIAEAQRMATDCKAKNYKNCN